MRLFDERDDLILDLVEIMSAAIVAGDWKVDGACDPEITLNKARAHLDRIKEELDKKLGLK